MAKVYSTGRLKVKCKKKAGSPREEPAFNYFIFHTSLFCLQILLLDLKARSTIFCMIFPLNDVVVSSCMRLR